MAPARSPEKATQSARPAPRAGSGSPTAGGNSRACLQSLRSLPFTSAAKAVPTRQKSFLVSFLVFLNAGLLLPLRVLTHPKLSSSSITEELSSTTCICLCQAWFYLLFGIVGVGEQALGIKHWVGRPADDCLRARSLGSQAHSCSSLCPGHEAFISTGFISVCKSCSPPPHAHTHTWQGLASRCEGIKTLAGALPLPVGFSLQWLIWAELHNGRVLGERDCFSAHNACFSAVLL